MLPQIRSNISILLALLIALVFIGCAPTKLISPESISTRDANGLLKQPECGVTRGSFLGSWFDYYERALSHADCQQWQNALTDLQNALGKRSKDTRNAYRLGLHFSDYFPHRELGIIYYNLGQFEESARELELSLEQFPTSKAELYLNRARLQLIKLNDSDRTKPVITLLNPRSDFIASGPLIEVVGQVTDDSFVQAIEINGLPYRNIKTVVVDGDTPVRVERAARLVPFSIEVPLVKRQGKGMITIVATDITGKRTELQHVIELDQQAPVIALEQMPGANQSSLKLHVSDTNSGLADIHVNGERVRSYKNNKYQSEDALEIEGQPNDTMIVSAIDRVGNKTIAKIPPVGGESNLALEIHLDKSSPIYTFENAAYLKGRVESHAAIKAIQIDGTPLTLTLGKLVYFGHLVDLELGKNHFKIVAEDTKGRMTESLIEVIRDQPTIHTVAKRLAVAQLPSKCNMLTGMSCLFSANVDSSVLKLMHERKRFRMIEQAQLEQLISQQILCRAGITEKCALILGDLLFAEGLFISEITERKQQDKSSIEINARMIDAETRDIWVVVDAYGEFIETTDVRELSRALVTEMSDAFPLVEGDILDVNGNRLTVDLNREDRIWPGMPFYVYRSNEVTASRIQDYTICGKVKVDAVREAASLVNWVGENQCEEIWAGLYKVAAQ